MSYSGLSLYGEPGLEQDKNVSFQYSQQQGIFPTHSGWKGPQPPRDPGLRDSKTIQRPILVLSSFGRKVSGTLGNIWDCRKFCPILFPSILLFLLFKSSANSQNTLKTFRDGFLLLPPPQTQIVFKVGEKVEVNWDYKQITFIWLNKYSIGNTPLIKQCF